MRLRTNNDIFVRKENCLGSMGIIVFSSVTSQLYESNEDIYNIISLCHDGIQYGELVRKLCEKYNENSHEEIIQTLDNIIPYLVSEGILIKESE